MAAEKCPGCGSKIDIGGLPVSIGGFDLYCMVCGHNWHIG